MSATKNRRQQFVSPCYSFCDISFFSEMRFQSKPIVKLCQSHRSALAEKLMFPCLTTRDTSFANGLHFAPEWSEYILDLSVYHLSVHKTFHELGNNWWSISKTLVRIILWCPTTKMLIKACYLIQPLEQEGGCQKCCIALCSKVFINHFYQMKASSECFNTVETPYNTINFCWSTVLIKDTP